MSSLTLVRHAQASFFADHYDQLSAVGETQARRLGNYWVGRQWTVDEVYVGPRRRQQQTATLVAESFRDAGLAFPEPVILPELDEYDLHGILHLLAPQLASRNNEFALLVENVRRSPPDQNRERHFQRMFEPLMLHWQASDDGFDGMESWRAFRDRVQRGLRHMVQSPGRGRRVVAFTSGGYIGTAVQCVLNAPDRSALEMNWRIRNGAVTEFLFSQDRITLDTFNTISHFDEPELLTYR